MCRPLIHQLCVYKLFIVFMLPHFWCLYSEQHNYLKSLKHATEHKHLSINLINIILLLG